MGGQIINVCAISLEFCDDELLVILEAAWVALAGAELFDRVAESVDLDDADMIRLRERLNAFMGGERMS